MTATPNNGGTMPNREEVIRMARECADVEADSRGRETFSFNNHGVERFAALVAAAKQEQCAKVCAQHGQTLGAILAAAIRALD